MAENKKSYTENFKKTLDWQMPFARTGRFPIDRTDVFSSFIDAQKYANGLETDPDSRGLYGTSYVGQVLTVYENDVVTVYQIEPDLTLKQVGKQPNLASGDTAGIVKTQANSGLSINEGNITLNQATAENLGGIKIGDGLEKEEKTGKTSLKKASDTQLGGVKVLANSGLNINTNGELSADVNWTKIKEKPFVNLNPNEFEVNKDSLTIKKVSSEKVTGLGEELDKKISQDGSIVMTGNLKMGEDSKEGDTSIPPKYKIVNLADGVAASDAVTKSQLDSSIEKAIEQATRDLGTVFDFKGVKEDYTFLPKEKNSIGDVWYVTKGVSIPLASDPSQNIFYPGQVGYIWISKTDPQTTGNGYWEQLGPTIDLSGYLMKDNLLDTTGSATDNTMTQKAITEIIAAIPVIKSKEGKMIGKTLELSYEGTIISTYSYIKNGDGSQEKILVDTLIKTNTVTFNIDPSVSEELKVYCKIFYI